MSVSELSIKEATKPDMIVDMWRKYLPTPPPVEHLTGCVMMLKSWEVYEGDRAVGFATLMMQDGPLIGTRIMHILHLFLAPKARTRAFRFLFRHLFSYAKKMEAKFITASLDIQTQTSIIRLFELMHFKQLRIEMLSEVT